MCCATSDGFTRRNSRDTFDPQHLVAGHEPQLPLLRFRLGGEKRHVAVANDHQGRDQATHFGGIGHAGRNRDVEILAADAQVAHGVLPIRQRQADQAIDDAESCGGCECAWAESAAARRRDVEPPGRDMRHRRRLDEDVGDHARDAIGRSWRSRSRTTARVVRSRADSSAMASSCGAVGAIVEQRRERRRVATGRERLLHAHEECADSVGWLRRGGRRPTRTP